MDQEQSTVIRVLVASPNDLQPERDRIPALLTRWNNNNLGVQLAPIMYESASTPELGSHPQHALNKQLIPQCALLIAMFWSKLGTPTPTEPSGTIEEIKEFIRLKGPRRVMLYFCDRHAELSPSQIDVKETERLQAFRNEMQSAGLYETFDSPEGLEGKIYQHLDTKGRDLLEGNLPTPQESEEAEEAGVSRPTWCDPEAPDVRLRKPFDLGNDFQSVSLAFSKKAQMFAETDGMTNDKYLKLGAHVFKSAAVALSEVLEYKLFQIPTQHRNGVRANVRKLEALADDHMDYLKKPWPIFWEEGAEVASSLRDIARTSRS